MGALLANIDARVHSFPKNPERRINHNNVDIFHHVGGSLNRIPQCQLFRV